MRDGTGWTAEIHIAESSGAGILDTQYILEGIFQTKGAALANAIASGKRVIDEKDIQSLIEGETKLPPTARHGFGDRSDDLAMGSDGQPAQVPSPGNPEDRYQ